MAKRGQSSGGGKPQGKRPKGETKDEAAERRGREAVEADQADLQRTHDRIKYIPDAATGEGEGT